VLHDKLPSDLTDMQGLVEEGIAYARVPQAARQPVQRVNLPALVDSLAGDYADAGQPVAVSPAMGLVVPTRPLALRRLLCNLIDNALKFAGQAELVLEQHHDPGGQGHWIVKVLDRGPGIPAADRSIVLQPFVRLEDARNRGTGETGLGLAIAAELAGVLGGTLELGARDDAGPGLSAALRVPVGAGRRDTAV
jgi:signal transduction histidine kinase